MAKKEILLLCEVCGKPIELFIDDPQQGRFFKCTNPYCCSSIRILPDNPPCSCPCQPCEHTDWGPQIKLDTFEELKKKVAKQKIQYFNKIIKHFSKSKN